MPNLESVQLEAVDDVRLNGIRYTDAQTYVEIGGIDSNSGISYRACSDFHLVRWPTALTVTDARDALLDIGSTVREPTVSVVYRDMPHMAETADLQELETISLDGLVQMSLLGPEDESIFSWRLPLDDEIHNQAVVYFANDGFPFPPSLADLVRTTIISEKMPTDLDRTLAAFHNAYEQYVDLIVD